MDVDQQIEVELVLLRRAIWQKRQCGPNMLEPADEVELLRMLREVRRFVEVPVPEERMPF